MRKEIFRKTSIFLWGIIMAFSTITYSQEIKLIIRGDDLGMTHGTLDAFERAFNEGVLTSGAIIVPGTWFEAAAQACRKNPGWCTGVHLCLVGEWRGARVRPVLPWDKVSSIVDEDGFFYTYPAELFARKPKLEDIEREFRAQIDLAKKKGINVQYLDTHYLDPNNTGYPGLNELIKKIASDYKLPVSGLQGEQQISVYQVPVEQKKAEAMRLMNELKPGLWLMICHPGIDSPEQHALIHSEPNAIFVNGGVGSNRAEELKILTSLDLKSIILKRGIILTNYRELWKEKQGGK